ncbi:peptidylprolyl isomerase [Draconibacterium sp. IB214405]|uniref:peptidylprolyl isomerase n=1 Tax=Draconibacterium sp. IB214405 TaxID=3097352 RepID=UPI002A0ECB09|nr:peptidylprolyl isomerase [Draconibacterium sp. IB214405]MDX8338443.1 peptidylprolyl isomerase [Draconibacterium sp. IB214405]
MRKLVLLFVGCIMLFCTSCDSEIEKGVRKSDLSKDVQLVTDFGTIVLRLSDETPIHRNNFIKLVNQGAYDSVSFHRVIENFLIQTGDMATKPAAQKSENNSEELSYMIDAEFRPDLLHKRGALNAARMGDDQNPQRASDGTQFTIIRGRVYTDSTLAIAEKRINGWLAYNNVINKPENKTELEKLKQLYGKMEALYEKENAADSLLMSAIQADIKPIKARFDSLTEIELITMQPYRFPEEHREIYKTEGGAAHLDQNYTVFGEVVTGMNVVDSIARVETDSADKPIDDVRILSATMIERK